MSAAQQLNLACCIADAIETLMALLDAIQGDPDLEEDDHSGDPLDIDGEGCGAEMLATLPIYGVDQSLGPVNENEAYIAHRMALLRPEFRDMQRRQA